MWLRRVSLSSVLLLALGSAIALLKPNSPFPASALQNLGAQKDGGQGEFRLMEQLNLNPDQKQKLTTIYSQYKDRIVQHKQAVRQATKELRELMVSNASADEVRAKYQQVTVMRQQLEATSFESMLAMRDVLTPNQRSQFAQLMEQQGKKFDNRMVQQRSY
jgi:Spy/CpxP family protein refolding chaperone